MKLFINSRDELRIIDLNKVVYLEACGNYTTFYFSDRHSRCETSTLSSFFAAINSLCGSEEKSTFFRVGRSYIVNTSYISAINIPKRTIYFCNNDKSFITVPKKQCAVIREFLFTKFKEHLNTKIV